MPDCTGHRQAYEEETMSRRINKQMIRFIIGIRCRRLLTVRAEDKSWRECKYLLQLYKALHPEDVTATEDQLTDITIRNVLTDNLYNDLGFNSISD